MTIAVYVRVSSTSQDTKSQELDLKKWTASQRDAVRWYRDNFTGTTLERPGLEKLLSDVRAGKVKKVVVWRLDRLGRTAKGLHQFFEELLSLKVGFLSLRDALDLSTPPEGSWPVFSRRSLSTKPRFGGNANSPVSPKYASSTAESARGADAGPEHGSK